MLFWRRSDFISAWADSLFLSTMCVRLIQIRERRLMLGALRKLMEIWDLKRRQKFSCGNYS